MAPTRYSITLTSLAKHVQTFNLVTLGQSGPHLLRPVRYMAARVELQRDGTAGQREVRHMLPDSITLLAGQKLTKLPSGEPLPDGIQNCPEILSATSATPPLVRVERVPVKEIEPASVAAPSSPLPEPTLPPSDAQRTEEPPLEPRPRQRSGGGSSSRS